MTRLIDADKTYKILTDYYHHNKDVQHIALTLALNKVPTVEAEPVRHGHWIDADDTRISGKCSVCGWEAHLYEDDVVGMPYCPNCGAKMDEVTQ